MEKHWQLTELNRALVHSEPDADACYLTDSTYREKIDDLIVEVLWPSVKQCVHQSPLMVTLGREKESVYDNIEQKWARTLTRTLTFLLSDLERPVGSESSRWFCRGTMECAARSYLLSFDFYLYFPVSFSMSYLLSLLKNPNFEGMPPELSYEAGWDGEGLWIVKFAKGKGHGGGTLTYGPVVAAQVEEEVDAILNVIYALNDLEIDYTRQASLDRLTEALVLAFQRS